MFNRSKDKGKGRSSETSPLLPSSSPEPSASISRAGYTPHAADDLDDHSSSPPFSLPSRSARIKPHLLTALYIFLAFLIAFILFAILLASSLVSSSSNQEQLVESFVMRGPEEVRVLNVTEKDGVWVEVRAFVGVDTDVALGFAAERDEDGGWWQRARKWTGRKSVETFSVASVTFPTPLHLYASPPLSFDEGPLFALLPSPSTILLPLTSSLHSSTPPIFSSGPNLKRQDVPAWLTPITMQFQASTVASPEVLLAFVKRSWAGQKVGVRVKMDRVEVSGVGKFLGMLKGEKEGISLDFVVPIPRIPSLPFPPPTNLTDLIHLDSYNVHRSRPGSDPSEPARLLVEATASAPNLLLGMTGEFPFEVEFEVGVTIAAGTEDGNDERAGINSIDNQRQDATISRIAIVHSKPISFNPSSPNLTVSVSGYIVSPSINFTTNSTPQSPLSAFIQAYLSSHPLPVVLTHLPNPHLVPPQLSTLLSAFTPLAFPIPPPNPPIKLIRSVTIEGMKIAGTQDGKEILASGTVVAEVEVPASLVGEEGVGVEVRFVRPDVLIYNGPFPSSTLSTPSSDTSPLPFARLQPPSFLPALTLPHPSGNPLLLIVRAEFTNLPLEIVSTNELSNFVSKILIKGGATAGVKGTADVKVHVEGLSSGGGGGRKKGDEGLLSVEGVMVEGEVWVGRGR